MGIKGMILAGILFLSALAIVSAEPPANNVVLYGNVFLKNDSPSDGAVYNILVYDNDSYTLLSNQSGIVGAVVEGKIYESQNTPNSADDIFNVTVFYGNETGKWNHVITSAEFESTVVEMPNMTLVLRPDLTLTSGDITYSPSSPIEGETVTIDATISNTGETDADNFKVEFLVDGISKANNTISVPASSSTTTQFTWTAEAGTHTIRIVADADNEIDESDETNNQAEKGITVKEIFTHNLSTGWNLVGYLGDDDVDIDTSLSSVNYSVIWRWNTSVGWQSYTKGVGGDFTTLDTGRGYWISANEVDEWNYTRITATSFTHNLSTGWNLVGYLGDDDVDIATSLSSVNYSVIWRWNTSVGWQSYVQGVGGDFSTLDTGRGYWISANEVDEWNYTM